MPIQPQIPLEVRPVEAPNPIQSYGNALALKSHIQQQQLQQQQMQENELAIQRNRQALQDQTTARETLARYNGDFDKALPELAGKVAPDFYMGLQQHNLNTKKTISEIADKDLLVTKDKNSRLLGLLDQATGMNPDDYAKKWPMIRAQAVTIHPELDKQLPAEPIPQSDLGTLRLGAQTTEQYLAGETARREKATADARIAAEKASTAHSLGEETRANALAPYQQTKAQTEAYQSAAGALSSATNSTDYETGYNAYPKDIQDRLPKPTEWTPETGNALRARSLTGEQANQAEINKANHEDLMDYRQQMVDLRKEQIERERKQTETSQGTDRRQARREYDTATAAESKLHDLRRSLGTAITSGKSYVDRLGNMRSMQDATKGNDTASDLLQQMKDRYQQISNDLKTTIANKYNAVDRLGGTPTKGLEESLADLDKGDEKLFGPKTPEAPKGGKTEKPIIPPPPPPASGGNALTAGPQATPPAPMAPPPPKEATPPAPKPAEKPAAPPAKNTASFRLKLPESVKGPDGKTYDSLTFPDEAAATKWATAHGLKLSK